MPKRKNSKVVEFVPIKKETPPPDTTTQQRNRRTLITRKGSPHLVMPKRKNSRVVESVPVNKEPSPYNHTTDKQENSDNTQRFTSIINAREEKFKSGKIFRDK